MLGYSREEPTKRPLATIFAADVFGHPTLLGADDASTQRPLNEFWQAVLELLIAHHHKSIDKLTSDGLLAGSSPSAHRAIVAGSKGISQKLSVVIGDKSF